MELQKKAAKIAPFMTSTKILKLHFKIALISLISSCTVSQHSVDLIGSKDGSGKLMIEMSNKLIKPELVFDSYCYINKLHGARRVVIEEFPAGKHFVRIYSGSWDTTIQFEVFPKQFNSLHINTP